MRPLTLGILHEGYRAVLGGQPDANAITFKSGFVIGHAKVMVAPGCVLAALAILHLPGRRTCSDRTCFSCQRICSLRQAWYNESTIRKEVDPGLRRRCMSIGGTRWNSRSRAFRLEHSKRHNPRDSQYLRATTGPIWKWSAFRGRRRALGIQCRNTACVRCVLRRECRCWLSVIRISSRRSICSAERWHGPLSRPTSRSLFSLGSGCVTGWKHDRWL
jgi:hypothetical protein